MGHFEEVLDQRSLLLFGLMNGGISTHATPGVTPLDR